MRYLIWIWLLAILLLASGCDASVSLPPSPSSTALPSPTSTLTPSPSPTLTPLPTGTSTPTTSPTVTASPSPSLTPTSEFPLAVVTEARAFCRYGPGKAYLYSHELKQGDQVEIGGRNYSKTWLWVKPYNLDRHCWAAASVLQVDSDVSAVKVVTSILPQSSLYGPPESVDAYRDGDEVTVEWEEVWMTEDDFRGYLIEATVCRNSNLVFIAVQTDDTSATIADEPGCSGPSEGKLYTVEKHGYTDPVDIPWPDD